MFDTFVNFKKWFSQVWLVLGILLYIFLVKDLFCHCTWLYMSLYWYVCAYYNGVCIYMFFHLITVSVLLYLCMLYNIIFGYTLSWYFFLYPPVHGLFRHCVIVTSVFVLICLCILYLWLLIYVCVLRTIWYLVALHLGNLVMHIHFILFVMPFFHPRWPTFTKVG